MFKKLLILCFLIIFLGCSNNKKDINISINNWIGYTPLQYIKEKGWLKDSNIKLNSVVSLMESQKLYNSGLIDGFTGTQEEYFLANIENDLLPIILLDRSNGGDLILSNQNLSSLKNINEKIDVYLEMGSINKLIFEYFIDEFNLKDKNLNLINLDQYSISKLKFKDVSKNTIIISYVPYSNTLQKSGFKVLASTKNINLLVVDAIFVNQKIFEENSDEFIKLKKLVDKAIEVLKKNPKEYYEVVKHYLDNQTYEEFIDSINLIEWINKNQSKKLLNSMDKHNVPTNWIIK